MGTALDRPIHPTFIEERQHLRLRQLRRPRAQTTHRFRRLGIGRRLLRQKRQNCIHRRSRSKRQHLRHERRWIRLDANHRHARFHPNVAHVVARLLTNRLRFELFRQATNLRHPSRRHGHAPPHMGRQLQHHPRLVTKRRSHRLHRTRRAQRLRHLHHQRQIWRSHAPHTRPRPQPRTLVVARRPLHRLRIDARRQTATPLPHERRRPLADAHLRHSRPPHTYLALASQASLPIDFTEDLPLHGHFSPRFFFFCGGGGKSPPERLLPCGQYAAPPSAGAQTPRPQRPGSNPIE